MTKKLICRYAFFKNRTGRHKSAYSVKKRGVAVVQGDHGLTTPEKYGLKLGIYVYFTDI
jgi:hypothetical protein